MQNFFDPNPHAEIMIPMYGTVHAITFVLMLAFIPLMIRKKESIKRLSANRPFMVKAMVLYIAIDALYWTLVWYHNYQPFYERLPFHLCGTLSLLLPVLVLTKSDKALRFFTFWAIAAGFISLVNPNFINDPLWSFAFVHYIIRHYFIFLLPIFLFIGKGYYFKYGFFLKSMVGLAAYAFLIFMANWAFGTNYMHLGQHNHLPISFLPESFSVWPWNYPAFTLVGIILFHIIFLILFLIRNPRRASESHAGA